MTDQGSSSVEFLLVLPAVLLLLAVVVETGGLVRSHLLALTAAREGARVAAMASDADAALNAARSRLGALSDSARIRIDRQWVPGGTATVEVEVRHPLFALAGGGLPVDIRARAASIVER
ncbi:MAG: pilus assembly protein [Acidimicrobiia bacterium]|nr:pilus assembly protein [Acidimicrobiia bacterium]